MGGGAGNATNNISKEMAKMGHACVTESVRTCLKRKFGI